MKIQKLMMVAVLLSGGLYFSQEKEKTTEKQIEEVKIVKIKKAVEQKADRTIFDFSEQPHLNSGSLIEGMKKLPGLIVSDVAGMMYQGKMLDVFLDNRPLGIYGNELQAFLDGMPANSVERVEIITQPGAEFPATSGGAIINIITNNNAKKYLSATYSGRYAFSNYDQFRSRVNNSILLNAKNKHFAWQLNVGQNYRESFANAEIGDISGTFSDRYQRGYFIKSGITFDLGKDKLLLNYDWFRNNNDAFTNSFGFVPKKVGVSPDFEYSISDYTTQDFGKTNNQRNEGNITYQKKFDDRSKRLDFQATYNKFNIDYAQIGSSLVENNTPNAYQFGTSSNQNILLFKTDFSHPLKILDEGKISLGALYENLRYDTQLESVTNLKYNRETYSAYAEAMAKYKNFDFIVGTRAERYNIYGKVLDDFTGTLTKDLTTFQQFRVFPNASLQYNFMKDVYFNMNYNKKIQLPSISSLNPNNTNFQNANIAFAGNPFLQPTIFDNYEVKISAFDYAFIGYSVSVAENQSVQVAEKNYFFPEQKTIEGRDAYGVKNGFINISDMKIHNINIGMPLPLMLFTKGLKEMMKFDFNPDKMNFLYLYAGYQLHEMPDLQNKGFWIFNIMAQIVLPKEIKLVANYNTMTKGNWFYYLMERPWNNSIDITATKKFLNDRLTVSVFANDIFRMNRNAVTSLYNNSNLFLGNRYDFQNFGISMNYKLPTKNKLAKEEQILQQNNEKEAETVAPL